MTITWELNASASGRAAEPVSRTRLGAGRSGDDLLPCALLLDRVLILREGHLRAVLTEYQVHYNAARSHQGIAQRVAHGKHDGGHLTVADLDRGRILRKPVLGGLINEYARAAWYPEEPQVTDADPDRKQSSILGQGPATLWRNAARGGG